MKVWREKLVVVAYKKAGLELLGMTIKKHGGGKGNVYKVRAYTYRKQDSS